MNSEKILALLGFAAKAGKLAYGTHATEFAIDKGSAKLVVAAADVSAKTVKELRFKADKKEISVITLLGIDGAALGKRVGKGCSLVSVLDEGFKDAVLKYC